VKFRMVVAVVIAIVLAGTIGLAQGKARTEKFEGDPFLNLGYFIGSCSPTVDVLNDAKLQITSTLHYDKDGVLVKEIDYVHLLEPDAYYLANHATGVRINGNTLYGNPGEHEVDHYSFLLGVMSFTGPAFRVTVPGYGTIFAETGHAIRVLPTWDWVANTGWNGFQDQDVAALCDYLK
jgi:hypothetical protein